MRDTKKIILCGGGTGGHIFPMLAIAKEFKKLNKNNKVLFVGSSDRMEMDIVPKYNFPIYGLWISGEKIIFYFKYYFFWITVSLEKFISPIQNIFFSYQVNIYSFHF